MEKGHKKSTDLEEAMQLSREEKYEEAIVLYDKVIESGNAESDVWRMKAQCQMMLGDLDTAYNTNQKAIDRDQNNMWALILMGNILARQEHTDEAKMWYDEVLKKHPDDLLAINNVGAAYMSWEMYDEAIRCFDKVIAKNPTYVNAWYGKAVAMVKQGHDEEAWEVLMDSVHSVISRRENPQVMAELNKVKVALAKRLAEKAQMWPEVEKLQTAIEEEGGLPVKMEEDPTMWLAAKVENGKIHGREYHRVIYNPKKDQTEHKIMHELWHLKMSTDASKEGKNEIPITDVKQVEAWDRRFAHAFNKMALEFGESKVQELKSRLRNGLALQLFNCPLDLLVEDALYRNYKELRPIQMLSLMNQEGDNIKSVEVGMATKGLPPAIVKANKVMNLIGAMHLQELYGLDFRHYYKASQSETSLAADLYEEFVAMRDDYTPGEEYDLCRYFIEQLGFDDLIVWANEDVAEPLDPTVVEGQIAANKAMREEIDEKNKEFAELHKDGADQEETMLMAMYMVGALQKFEGMATVAVKKIALEIATIGMTGISPNKTSGYKVPSLPGEDFGGYRLLAYYYVSFALALPELLDKLNLPFSKAYEVARQMYNKPQK